MSFNIYNSTLLGNDKSAIEHATRQSAGPGNYSLATNNTYPCEAPAAATLAVTQPDIYFRDGYGWTSGNGCNIDNDSYFRLTDNLTNHRCIQQLNPRYALTTPYKGRGFINTGVVIEGNNTHISKSCAQLDNIGVSRFTPLIKNLRQNIQNPRHLIQEQVDSDWVRGGIPSRQIIRNIDYNKKLYQK